jgi:primary-amine oxidase
MPSGFFDRNPGIDLAPGTNAASRHAKACCS